MDVNPIIVQQVESLAGRIAGRHRKIAKHKANLAAEEAELASLSVAAEELAATFNLDLAAMVAKAAKDQQDQIDGIPPSTGEGS